MANVISAFPLGTIEGVSRIIGDLYSGTEITRIMAKSRFVLIPAKGTLSGADSPTLYPIGKRRLVTEMR